MNYIVLVKQVPDISQISENVFNPETGTLVRSKLSGIINPLDEQALGFAVEMRRINNDNSRIIALSMGPSSAEQVLRFALARGADEAILLTDKRLGGADTWATAASLSRAIKRIETDFFAGSKDYFIVSGMQSIDGDTAQVPPQIAESLQIGCVGYATGVQFNETGFEFTQITSNASAVVRVKQTPAVITVAKYEYPPFATLQSTRMANSKPITYWTSDDIDAQNLGSAGSKTQVIEIFPPGKTNRKCIKISSVQEFTNLLIKAAKSKATPPSTANSGLKYLLPEKREHFADRSFEYTEKENEHFKLLADELSKIGIDDDSNLNDNSVKEIIANLNNAFHEKTTGDMLEGLKTEKSRYQGDVWVVGELSGGKIHSSTFELISKAADLAKQLCQKTAVVILGNELNAQPSSFGQQLIDGGADIVYYVNHRLLEIFEPSCHKNALTQIISQHRPQIVLFSATPQGRLLAPMTAFALNCGLTADCTGLEIKDITRKGEVAILLQTRPALGGNIMASIYTKNSDMQFASVRPGVFQALPPLTPRSGEIKEFIPKLDEQDLTLEIISTEKIPDNTNFDVEAVICGGKGLKSADNYNKLITTLAEKFAARCNITAQIGATRAAVEHGFIERAHQVGQTGSTVSAKVYLALAVSGAIQHLIGISASQNIFAINNDPAAPIFKHCDYYFVGSVEEIVPQIIDRLQASVAQGGDNGK